MPVQLKAGDVVPTISPYAPADVLFAMWKRHIGIPAPVTDTVQRLTSRPPRSVKAWAADMAAHLR
jgi:hypothetical protein